MEGAQRVALLAGSADETPQAIGRELVRRGWTLVMQAGDEEALQAAVEQIGELADSPDQVVGIPGEAHVAEDREALVEFVLDELGRVDLLVSAPAGPTVNENLLELGEDAYGQVMSACLTAPLFLSQLVANEMVRLTEAGEIESGKIVLVNSLCAYTSATERAARCLAASAGAMLTRLLADALGEHGVNVYEVRAGLISAGESGQVRARYDRLIEEGLTPIRRWGRPRDVALAVAAVAEDLLPYSTGEVINVDGGFHLRRL